ncbi:hypothetical protein [Bacillus nitratireducens]|uniref:hypothetical protein n=1 Tax=Bacillus nitratireducens TaxID=2026193 RepID=UPI00089B6A2E|nr:hypothetical protein [Bacillus nitratireducens]SEB14534.1 hypothetical protein SAMN04488146_110107 [Bacillus nitratireducens]
MIYYWSHEYEFGENPEEYVFYITNSLKTFKDSMVEDEQFYISIIWGIFISPFS